MSQGLRPRSSAVSARQSPLRFRDLESVELQVDLPEHALKKGEVGTIVHVFDTADAYLVEFVHDDGSTKAEVELTPQQIGAT